MKSFVLTCAFLFSQISFAAPAATTERRKIDLAMELSLNGELVSSPKTIVTEGDPATVTQKAGDIEYFITIATMKVDAPKGMKNPENKKVIKFQFAIGKTDKNGKETILNRPTLVVLEGQPAIVKATTEKSSMALSVIAKYL